MESNGRRLGSRIDAPPPGGPALVCIVARFVDRRAAGAIHVWLLRSIDGTTFEDGSEAYQPERQPDVSFRPRTLTTDRQVLVMPVWLEPGPFKVLLWCQLHRTIPNPDTKNAWREPYVFPATPAVDVESVTILAR